MLREFNKEVITDDNDTPGFFHVDVVLSARLYETCSGQAQEAFVCKWQRPTITCRENVGVKVSYTS